MAEPTFDRIRNGSNTVEISEAALERLLMTARGSWPKCAADRQAIQEGENALDN